MLKIHEVRTQHVVHVKFSHPVNGISVPEIGFYRNISMRRYKMAFKIVHTYSVPDVDHGDALVRTLDADLVKGLWVTEDEIINNARHADAIIGVVSMQPFSRRVLETLTNCRIIAGIAIGFEAIDLDASTELGIAVTNVPDYCLDEVSGLVTRLMLALGHKITQIDRAVRERQINFTGGGNAIKEVGYPAIPAHHVMGSVCHHMWRKIWVLSRHVVVSVRTKTRIFCQGQGRSKF